MSQKHWETLTLLQNQFDQTDEFNRKYRNTYLFLKTPEQLKPSLVLFHGVDGDYFLFSDVFSGANYKIRYETDIQLSASFPDTKLVNHRGHVFFTTRIPARQHRKAPCNENFYIANLFDDYNYQWSFVLYDSYFPKYLSYQQAMALLKGEKTSAVALNPKFAISLHSDSDDKFFIWMYNNIIGEINGEKIKPISPIFSQELIDFTRRNLIPLEVV